MIEYGFEDAWWALFIICFGPIVAFVSTWILYAYGQLVEDTHKITEQNSKILNIDQNIQIMAQPMIDEANEKAKREAEEAERKAQTDSCPKCKLEHPSNRDEEFESEYDSYEGVNAEPNTDVNTTENQKCELCGNYVEHLTYCEIKDDFGTRYRSICDDCITKNKAKPKK